MAQNIDEHDVLFDGSSDELFKLCAKACDVYGEYGSGQSTQWVYRNTNSQVISAET